MLDKVAEVFKNTVVEDHVVLVVLLVAMFFVSGVDKVYHFDATIDSLCVRTTLPIFQQIMSVDVCRWVIVAVIALEILAPLVIVANAVTGQYVDLAYTSVILLSVFTVLATFVYHMPDFSNYKKSLAFWANVSLLGGLLLLAKMIRTRV